MKSFLVAIICALFVANITQLFTSTAVSASASEVCSAQTGTFAASATSAVADDDGAAERSEAALQWIKQMMDPTITQGDGSAVVPTADYGVDHQGEVSGAFELAASTPLVSSSPLKVTSPEPLVDSYRGIVNGTSTYIGSRYVVKAYLVADIAYEQPGVIPGQVGDDGAWILDLSPIPQNWVGSWSFRLYDTVTSQLVGDSWPQPETYQNIVVQAFSVADQAYLQHTQPARADNTWTFPSMGQGTKMFRLYNSATEQILAEYYQPERTGLIRSYEFKPGQDGYGTSRAYNSYMYDQALALLVAIGADDKVLADELLQGLASAQTKTGPFIGAFPSHADQRDPSATATYYYTGGNSIVAYALIKYFQHYGDQGGVQSMLEAVLDFIETQKTTEGPASGLYRGGGELTLEGTANYIAWHSTEHNTDLWHTFELAGRLLGGSYKEEAARLSNVIIETLWNTSEQRFNQGYQDTNYALDTASWGGIFLAAVGETEKARQSIEAAEAYKTSHEGLTGYTPYMQDPSNSTVWYEGTFGVALAQHLIYNSEESMAAQTIRDTYAAQGENGAWQYVLLANPADELTDAYSVASTAWYLLATDYTEVMWSECVVPASVPDDVTDETEVVMPPDTIKPSQPEIVSDEPAEVMKTEVRTAGVKVGATEVALLEEDTDIKENKEETAEIESRPFVQGGASKNNTIKEEIQPEDDTITNQLPVAAVIGAAGISSAGAISYGLYRRHRA